MEPIHVVVKTDNTVLYKENGHKEQRRPILVASGTKAKLDFAYAVSASAILADGGKTYYNLQKDTSLYLRVDDVIITKASYVEVKANDTVIYMYNALNKTGHPIMIPFEMKANKGDQFFINPVKISPEDKGDGIIHADGGKTYYSVGGRGGFYLSVEDVTKV